MSNSVIPSFTDFYLVFSLTLILIHSKFYLVSPNSHYYYTFMNSKLNIYFQRSSFIIQF